MRSFIALEKARPRGYVKRLDRELADVLNNPIDGVSVQPCTQDEFLIRWNFSLKGSAANPFAFGSIDGYVIFPLDYRFKEIDVTLVNIPRSWNFSSGRFREGEEITFEKKWSPNWHPISRKNPMLDLLAELNNELVEAYGTGESFRAPREKCPLLRVTPGAAKAWGRFGLVRRLATYLVSCFGAWLAAFVWCLACCFLGLGLGLLLSWPVARLVAFLVWCSACCFLGMYPKDNYPGGYSHLGETGTLRFDNVSPAVSGQRTQVFAFWKRGRFDTYKWPCHNGTKGLMALKDQFWVRTYCLRDDGIFLGERIIIAETSGPLGHWTEEWVVCSDGTARLLSEDLPGGASQRGRVRAPFWGITLRQIGELLVEVGFLSESLAAHESSALKPDVGVRDFVKNVIKPRTRGKGQGYALMINAQTPLEVEVMVSHSWEEGILEFFFALRRSSLARKPDVPLFVCFLSLYQNDDPDLGVTVAQQCGQDPTVGPFVEVLHNFKRRPRLRVKVSDLEEMTARGQYWSNYRYMASQPFTCGTMVLVPNKFCNIYTRMWCVLELYTASVMGVPTVCAFNAEGILDPSVSSKHARCGNPNMPMNDDERNIRAAIETSSTTDYRHLDQWIRNFDTLYGARMTMRR